MRERSTSPSEVRVPATSPGEPTSEISAGPAAPSEAAIEAYFELETPEEAVTDAETIHRLFRP
jgi:hypothetical protein